MMINLDQTKKIAVKLNEIYGYNILNYDLAFVQRTLIKFSDKHNCKDYKSIEKLILYDETLMHQFFDKLFINVSEMFRDTNIVSVDFSELDTSAVVNFSYMLHNTVSLVGTCTTFDVSLGENFEYLFAYSKLDSTPAFDFKEGIDFYRSFFKMPNNTNPAASLFPKGQKIADTWRESGVVNFPRTDFPAATNMYATWYKCYELLTFGAAKTDEVQLGWSACTNYQETFGQCRKLVWLPQLHTSGAVAVTRHRMFAECNKLFSIGRLNTQGGANKNQMFHNCHDIAHPNACERHNLTDVDGDLYSYIPSGTVYYLGAEAHSKVAHIGDADCAPTNTRLPFGRPHTEIQVTGDNTPNAAFYYTDGLRSDPNSEMQWIQGDLSFSSSSAADTSFVMAVAIEDDGQTYFGVRLYNGNIEFYRCINGVFSVNYRAPGSAGDWVRLEVKRKDDGRNWYRSFINASLVNYGSQPRQGIGRPGFIARGMDGPNRNKALTSGVSYVK